MKDLQAQVRGRWGRSERQGSGQTDDAGEEAQGQIADEDDFRAEEIREPEVNRRGVVVNNDRWFWRTLES